MSATEKPLPKTVVHPKYGAGPHGIGDPDDKSLRRVELDVLVPKKMRDKARTENCKTEVEAFNACCKEHSLYMIFKCKDVSNVMKDCLAKWYNDDNFKKLCTEEYLKERSEYRRTGITQQMKRFGY